MASFWTSNRGRLALAGVLVAALGGLVYYQLRSGHGRLPKGVRFVCVATGKTYWLDRNKVVVLPAENPQTGQMTLLPAYVKDGVTYVDSRYREAVIELGDQNRHVDPETLAVRTVP